MALCRFSIGAAPVDVETLWAFLDEVPSRPQSEFLIVCSEVRGQMTELPAFLQMSPRVGVCGAVFQTSRGAARR